MTTPRQIDFSKMTDEEIDEYIVDLTHKKQEALRIYQLARQTLRQINEFYDFQIEKISESRKAPPLPRMDSNHRGMD